MQQEWKHPYRTARYEQNQNSDRELHVVHLEAHDLVHKPNAGAIVHVVDGHPCINGEPLERAEG